MPITIGSLSNVPSPGSPITSPWAQDVTRLATHRFTNKAALDGSTWDVLEEGQQAITLNTGTLWKWSAAFGYWYTTDPWTFTHTENLAAVPAKNFVITYGVTFIDPPHVTANVIVGSNADIVLNWQSAPGLSTVSARVATNAGGAVSLNVGIMGVARGRRLA